MSESKRGPIDINGASPDGGDEANREQASDQGNAEARYERPPRRPRGERKAFDAAGWLMEGILGLSEEIQHNDLGLSKEFWTHAYAARKETLLALRALLDNALERCESDEENRAKAPPRRGKVDIAFGDSE